MDVNVERAEDVLTHKRLLELAKDPAQRPAFAVRAVQVRSAPPHTTTGVVCRHVNYGPGMRFGAPHY
jgi:hypothetical protein